MNNYSTDSRVNNPRLRSPLEPNYVNPSSPRVPQSGEYDYSNTYISRPVAYPERRPGYPSGSPLHPAGSSVYPTDNPAYQAPRIAGPDYYNQQDNLMVQSQFNHLRCASSTFFLLINVVVLALLIVSLIVPWFNYCYFAFGLMKEDKTIDKSINKGSGTNSLDSFYDDVCKPDRDYFKYCPHFCRSIKDVIHSSKIMLIFAIVVLSLNVLTIFLVLVKLKMKRAKIPRVLFLILPPLSLVLYLVGYVVYYETSKFSSFSDTKTDWDSLSKSPDDFRWGAGIIIAIPISMLHLALTVTSRNLVRTLYAN
jgi:hypothetical protein